MNKEFLHKVWPVIKSLIPPALLKILRKYKDSYGCFGNYATWEDALKDSSGYNSPRILEKVKNSTLLVKSGKAKYERDSVIYDSFDFSYPFISGLLLAAAANDGELRVIDYGGSLGTTYFLHRQFFRDLKRVNWNVVEQPHFVDCGRENVEDEIIKFHYSIDECLKQTQPSVFILSSVLQYLKEPYSFLERIAEYGFPFLLFDRTAFMLSDFQERLTVQKVHPMFYEASYPAWFLKKNAFMNILNGYELVFEFQASEQDTVWSKVDGRFMGFFFRKKLHFS
ncbi:MAG: methyltransferase, TIGR04325 family [Candidatus Riflebacteria bacterium]|nr:methyltransferase, TIGR04325 family [Candidatus Riflebacteria bacterium]